MVAARSVLGRSMNLFLAVFWLLAALVLFAAEWTSGQSYFRIRGLDVSSAWFLVLMSGYNLARWASIRSARAERDAMVRSYEQKIRAHRRPMPAEPDPTFDFTTPPAVQAKPNALPPPSNGQPPTAPPGNN